jgi:hypothetical protein
MGWEGIGYGQGEQRDRLAGATHRFQLAAGGLRSGWFAGFHLGWGWLKPLDRCVAWDCCRIEGSFLGS